ncbi:uncharacterized protein KIAA0825 [Trichonephila clavipes]|uniref:Uncharacterized protein KIAA0825 n=1 Tax=Trichonephila clavipes TaxID=2585209 RepID=A0A8X6W6D8_TRICX|nr:uncharacterized protein KIAA0825 [Trichonephila clavipes]
MKGLLHDMTYFLPQNYAQKLYLKVLSSSLEHFLVRYSAATPSESRTSQIMSDLYALLLCASDLLWPACSSAFQFMGRKFEMAENLATSCISKIHSSCCFLLADLVVLTAPICELFKVFKNGFPQARLSVRTKYESVSPWLPWIRRELFSEFCQRQIISNVSVWLAVKTCISWALPNPAAVIQPNGAPPLSTRFVEHHQWIGRSLFRMSPDLTPWDFFLWGSINVYVPPLPADLPDTGLKQLRCMN